MLKACDACMDMGQLCTVQIRKNFPKMPYNGQYEENTRWHQDGRIYICKTAKYVVHWHPVNKYGPSTDSFDHKAAIIQCSVFYRPAKHSNNAPH